MTDVHSSALLNRSPLIKAAQDPVCPSLLGGGPSRGEGGGMVGEEPGDHPWTGLGIPRDQTSSGWVRAEGIGPFREE